MTIRRSNDRFHLQIVTDYRNTPHPRGGGGWGSEGWGGSARGPVVRRLTVWRCAVPLAVAGDECQPAPTTGTTRGQIALPTYQYRCTECDHAFEEFQSFTDDALTVCPVCGGRLRKVFNAVGVVFKGSGFYRNDSRSSSTSDAGAASSGASTGSDSAPKKAAESGGSSTSSGSSESSSSSSTSSSTTAGSSTAS